MIAALPIRFTGCLIFGWLACACSSSDEKTDSKATTLIARDWKLSSGDEGYLCTRTTVPRDMWIKSFSPLSPTGTHHTVLTIAGPGGELGDFDCDGGSGGPNMIYGSGVGTEKLELPPGFAVRLSAGQTLVLNLHLFNTSSKDLTGHSGIEVETVDEGEVEHEAEVVLAGKREGLVAAPGTTTQTGFCTMADDVTVFAVLPHMHQLGAHMKVTALVDSGDVVLLDTPYAFDDQQYRKLDPIAIPGGKKVQVDCTYENPGAKPIYYGDSSLSEMCYAGLYRYPPVAKLVTCTQ